MKKYVKTGNNLKVVCFIFTKSIIMSESVTGERAVRKVIYLVFFLKEANYPLRPGLQNKVPSNYNHK